MARLSTATLLVVLAFALRLFGIGDESLWGDELFTWNWTQFDHGFLWGEGRPADPNPPLYYSLLVLWRQVVGGDEWGLRSLSALASALSVGVCYAIGRLLLGQTVAVLSAVALILSPFAWHYAQEARPVALLPLTQGLMLLGTTLYLVRAQVMGEAPNLRQAALPGLLFVFGAVSSIYLHTTSVILLAATGCVVSGATLMHHWLGRRALVFWAGVGAISVTLSMPVLMHSLLHSYHTSLNWVPPLSLTVLITNVSQIAAGTGLGSTGGGVVAAAAIYVTAAWSAWEMTSARSSGVTAVLVLVAIPVVFMLLLAATSVVRPLFVARFGLGTLIPLSVLLGAAAASTLHMHWTARVVVFCIALGLPGVLAMRELFVLQKEDWRALVRTYEADPTCRSAPVYASTDFATLGWPFYASSKEKIPPRTFIGDNLANGVGVPMHALFLEQLHGERYAPTSEFRTRLDAGKAVVLISVTGSALDLEAMTRARGGHLVQHTFVARGSRNEVTALQMLCLGAR